MTVKSPVSFIFMDSAPPYPAKLELIDEMRNK